MVHGLRSTFWDITLHIFIWSNSRWDVKDIPKTDCVLNNSKPKSCDQTDLQAYVNTTEVKVTTKAIRQEMNAWR